MVEEMSTGISAAEQQLLQAAAAVQPAQCVSEMAPLGSEVTNGLRPVAGTPEAAAAMQQQGDSSVDTAAGDAALRPAGAAAVAASHAFSTLFIVDFTVVKAGTITEIVEMAWIIFDVDRRAAVEETSVLVRPEQLLLPAEVLTRLGATQEELAAASTLADAVSRFDEAVFRKCQETRKPTLLCAFGRQKLARDLRACASSRHVTLFTHYSHFVDVKPLLRDILHLKGEALASLGSAAAALQEVGVPAERGDGVAACRCLCAIMSLLLSKGLVLRKDHEVTVDEADADASLAAAGIGVGVHLRLRGLPWDITEDAVIRFLKPVANIDEADVSICLGLDKRVTGEAFVACPSAATRDLAVRTLHGRMLGQRWIEVFRASPEDYERGTQRRQAVLNSDAKDCRDADVRGLNLTVLKLRGLPWSCTEREIIAFCKEHGFEVRLEDVVLGVAPDGRLSGMAFVDLNDAETADSAKEKLHRKYLGRRFVEVYPSTREEMSRARRPGRVVPDMGGGPLRSRGRGGGHNGAAGPYSGNFGASAGGGVGLNSLGGGGIPTMGVMGGTFGGYSGPGDVYGGYAGSPQPAYAAAVAGLSQQHPQDAAAAATTPPSAGWNYPVLRLRGMPFNANEQQIVQFFQGFHMAAILPSTIPIDGRPSGEAYVQFADANEAWRALQTRNGSRMERRYIELFPASKQEMNFAAQGGDPRMFRERNRAF